VSTQAVPAASEHAGEHQEGEDPLACWLRAHMDVLGARTAQAVVVREGVVAYARTVGHSGPATSSRPMRLGSVSKVLLGLATAGALRRAALPGGFETPLAAIDQPLRAASDAPGGARGWGQGGRTALRRVTIGQLLTHTAGLRTAAEIRPDDPRHPLSEVRIAADLGRSGPLVPGDLLRWFAGVGDDAVFARAPGTGRPDYGNEGAILLGEVLARFTLGDEGRFGDVLERMFRAASVDVGPEGALFAAGLSASRARNEVAPLPTTLSWAAARFDEGRAVASSPYADNGPYLGAAAGVSVPIASFGRLVAAIGRPSKDPWAPTRADLAQVMTPCPLDGRYGHGVMLGRPTYWTFRTAAGGAARTVRVVQAHHHGRVDGGAALHLHLVPIDPSDGDGIAITVAFDRLGPLTAEVEGQQLLGVLRALEGSPGWGEPAGAPFG
jgi:CubicO group peptidase (beta-lactamase class C family)